MKIIAKIIRGIWSALNLFRNIVFNIIFLILLIAIIGAMGQSTGPTVIPDGAALLVAPKGQIVDKLATPDLATTLTGGYSGQTELFPLLRSIRTAAEDEYIKALVLQLDDLGSSGFSKLRELGEALQEFKASGKPIYASGDTYSQGQYYLASFADEILLNPYGGVDLEGFSSWQPYFREALDKLAIDVHIFRVGEYKSAVEPYELNGMSDQSRANYRQWLNEVWQVYQDDIIVQRGINSSVIDNYVNALDEQLAAYDGDTAQLALESGLVDHVLSRHEANDYLTAQLGEYQDTKSFSRIKHQDYLAIKDRLFIPKEQQVGVIVATGTINDGEGAPGSIGGDSLAELIRTARETDQYKALVLRIDSPGGSAFASEIIRRELLYFKDSGKPLVVSMGSTAASGGYWISAPADEIWANAATITGSIGIFAMIPGFDRALDNLGVNIDGVGTSEMSGALVAGRPLPDIAARAIQQILENGYSRFLNIVAEGRDMTTEQVNDVGQGQVWTGQHALELGLVDQLGNLDDAIASAAEMAGLTDYDAIIIQPALSPWEELMQQIAKDMQTGGVTASLFPGFSATLMNIVNQGSQHLEALLDMDDPENLYLHCMECLFE